MENEEFQGWFYDRTPDVRGPPITDDELDVEVSDFYHDHGLSASRSEQGLRLTPSYEAQISEVFRKKD